MAMIEAAAIFPAVFHGTHINDASADLSPLYPENLAIGEKEEEDRLDFCLSSSTLVAVFILLSRSFSMPRIFHFRSRSYIANEIVLMRYGSHCRQRLETSCSYFVPFFI
jgi:hypothetical protein